MALTQSAAAAALGLSVGGYRTAEYQAMDRAGAPVRKTLALLAQALERAPSLTSCPPDAAAVDTLIKPPDQTHGI